MYPFSALILSVPSIKRRQFKEQTNFWFSCCCSQWVVTAFNLKKKLLYWKLNLNNLNHLRTSHVLVSFFFYSFTTYSSPLPSVQAPDLLVHLQTRLDHFIWETFINYKILLCFRQYIYSDLQQRMVIIIHNQNRPSYHDF